MPPRRFHRVAVYRDVGLFSLCCNTDTRFAHNFNGETMAAVRFACVFSQSGRVIFTETDEGSRFTAERIICFRGTQTVPVAARNERLTPPQRIVTRIIRDISRCPHGPVVSKFYCPAPYFTCPWTSGPA